MILAAVSMLPGVAHGSSCCECGSDRSDKKRPDEVVCLRPEEMSARVDHIEPLRLSGPGKGLNISGNVVLEVRFDLTGKVACARANSGHPIAIAAAMEAIKRWTFRPLTADQSEKSGCGQIHCCPN